MIIFLSNLTRSNQLKSQGSNEHIRVLEVLPETISKIKTLLLRLHNNCTQNKTLYFILTLNVLTKNLQ